jgi:hypothetical protein
MGHLSNDELLTNIVAAMIDAKMDVACQTLEKDPSKFDTLLPLATNWTKIFIAGY